MTRREATALRPSDYRLVLERRGNSCQARKEARKGGEKRGQIYFFATKEKPGTAGKAKRCPQYLPNYRMNLDCGRYRYKIFKGPWE
jgi:hypothetical protein